MIQNWVLKYIVQENNLRITYLFIKYSYVCHGLPLDNEWVGYR